MPKFRTNAQNSRMFGLAAKCGLSHEDLRDWTAEITEGRTDHTSELYTNEADTLIKRIEKLVTPKAKLSRRTINYRRQKAGIVQIVTPEQMNKIQRLAAQRNMSDEGLISLCRRNLRKNDQTLPAQECLPKTTAEANKVIEALKAMNKRNGIFGAFKKKEAA